MKGFSFSISLLQYLQHSKPFIEMVALHDEELKPKSLFCGIDQIRKYFGDNISIYFYFMNFYIMWLSIPGFFGLLIYFLHRLDKKVKDNDSPYDTIYAIFVILWANVFYVYW